MIGYPISMLGRGTREHRRHRKLNHHSSGRGNRERYHHDNEVTRQSSGRGNTEHRRHDNDGRHHGSDKRYGERREVERRPSLGRAFGFSGGHGRRDSDR